MSHIETSWRGLSIDDRLWKGVRRVSRGCWNFMGYRTSSGYGQLWYRGKLNFAHRISYVRSIGPIPKGLIIHHICENRRCINPEHLKPVSMGLNTLLGNGPTAKNARKKICKRGHKLAGRNLYVYPWGYRVCRTCKRKRSNAHISKFQLWKTAGWRRTARARAAVRRAIKQGKIVRPRVCSKCKRPAARIEAHHWKGYLKKNWLDVVWLCGRCHRKEQRRS